MTAQTGQLVAKHLAHGITACYTIDTSVSGDSLTLFMPAQEIVP